MEQKNGQIYRFEIGESVNNKELQKRVLVLINTIDAGGAETFVMKVFREIRKEGWCFDFLINKADSKFYKKEILESGGRIYIGMSKSKYPIKCFKFIRKIVSENKYNTVFCVSAHPAAVLDIIAAKKGGVKKVITRSANANIDGKLRIFVAKLFRPLINRLSDIKLAPSTEAGVWMFGNNCLKKAELQLVNNALDTNRYCFDSLTRLRIRDSFGLSTQDFAICHIGRFSYQKNHNLLIDIFKEVKSEWSRAKLFLVGNGELKETIENKVKDYGLVDSVKFVGIRDDIPDFLMGMDMMIFPSFYEGLPNVVIEAQATGLKCIVSDRISKEVILTDLVKMFSIKSNISDIVMAVREYYWKTVTREIYNKILKDKGYDIQDVAKKMIEWFS